MLQPNKDIPLCIQCVYVHTHTQENPALANLSVIPSRKIKHS